MGNSDDLFTALGCATRLRILQLICDKEMHISGIARELNISVPVTLKHIRILEKAGLVNREIFGNSHILKADIKGIYHAIGTFAPKKTLEVESGTSLLDALKKISSVKSKKVGDKEIIVSINGEEGFFVYELNGQLIDKTVQECFFEENAFVEWKKLEPVTKIKLNIIVKK
ncbi:ArsR family transcriptional regulator [Methanosalsum natronophilum]|uniref:ArsR family transcriptional regulator n=2 Tax=Methanosalsum natronophilum TaxID=768733 RepID=A0A424YU74_9EURY|nr:MAG: ArsR family transcriptional regulator [Methanosalsum natronophilum]